MSSLSTSFRVAVLAGLVAATPALAAETVDLDLEKFLGTWYELARYDHRFERGCVGVTATYSRKPDSKDLKVVNRCEKEKLGGEVKDVEGKAWVPNPKEPGKLKVQFFWPFSGDYWVHEIAPDYSWAIVGGPDKDSCWILSRTPTLPEETYAALLEKLKARGYSPEKLIRVEQRPPQ